MTSVTLSNSHSLGNVPASRQEHAAHAKQRSEKWRRNTHQAHEGNHLVEGLYPVILVLSLINKTERAPVEEFTDDVERVPDIDTSISIIISTGSRNRYI